VNAALAPSWREFSSRIFGSSPMRHPVPPAGLKSFAQPEPSKEESIVKGRSAHRVSLLVLTALLGLAVVVGGSASAADDVVIGVTAKKKCKKKKHRSASSAKKKKCKKKKKVPPPVPATTRATLTWSPGSTDLNLYAWDTGGVMSPSPGIASTSHSGNVAGGPEVFRDLLSPSSRQFAYGVCTVSVSTPTDWTLTVVSAGGNTQTTGSSDFGPFTAKGENVRVTYTNPNSFDPGGGIANGWCPT
jgi:hypothetical protein